METRPTLNAGAGRSPRRTGRARARFVNPALSAVPDCALPISRTRPTPRYPPDWILGEVEQAHAVGFRVVYRLRHHRTAATPGELRRPNFNTQSPAARRALPVLDRPNRPSVATASGAVPCGVGHPSLG